MRKQDEVGPERRRRTSACNLAHRKPGRSRYGNTGDIHVDAARSTGLEPAVTDDARVDSAGGDQEAGHPDGAWPDNPSHLVLGLWAEERRSASGNG